MFEAQDVFDARTDSLVEEWFRAHMRLNNLDVETRVRRLCDEIWFPRGYRVEELAILQRQGIPFLASPLRIVPSRRVGAFTLLLRRAWRRFRPYRYERFLGRTVR